MPATMSTSRAVAHVENQVKRALEASGLTPGKRLVVAVSGGPDSLAMLYALHRLKTDQELELYGAHLDHGIRGGESEADARFVTETFRGLGIDFTSEREDVPSFKKTHRLSTEEAAREVRYGFLYRVAHERRADAVAVGHTADDQAETVLMNIIRGSGLAGLRGMELRARRTFAGKEVLLVRPLLNLSRQDTVEYCRAQRLKPRLDRSNLSTEPTRNRVRLKLLPILEEFNPAVRDALTRLSRSATQDDEHLESEVDTVWPAAVREGAGHVAIDKAAYNQLGPAVQARLLRRAVALAEGSLDGIEHVHIDEMAQMMSGAAGRNLDLPRGIRFAVGYREATITYGGTGLCGLPPLKGDHLLKIPGETQICGWRVEAKLVEQSTEEASVGKYDAGSKPEHAPYGLTAYLGRDALRAQTRVRARRPGDRFQPLGMSQPKKLQDFMVDAKVPRQWRDRVPLVVSADGIAWVVGWRIAEWAKVKKGTPQAVEIRFLEGGQNSA